MSNKSLLSQLMELAQDSASFSAGVLGSTQAGKSDRKIKNTKFAGKVGYENEEVSKVERARHMLKIMLQDEDFDRQEVLNKLMKNLGITEETATSYFQRIAKEMGLTGGAEKEDNKMAAAPEAEDDPNASKDQQLQPGASTEPELPDEGGAETPLEPPEGTTTSDDPDKQGAIRTIKNAHMIYKRQNEEGTYDELWIYNIQSNVADELDIRRDILAGTDIQPKRQSSEDGQQSYRLTTMGNAQMLEITGLPQ